LTYFLRGAFFSFQRWRRRWFVLQQAQGQYVLNYFTDDTRKKLKGTILLDDCEQVKKRASTDDIAFMAALWGTRVILPLCQSCAGGALLRLGFPAPLSQIAHSFPLFSPIDILLLDPYMAGK
jgi:hypothetical protein